MRRLAAAADGFLVFRVVGRAVFFNFLTARMPVVAIAAAVLLMDLLVEMDLLVDEFDRAPRPGLDERARLAAFFTAIAFRPPMRLPAAAFGLRGAPLPRPALLAR